GVFVIGCSSRVDLIDSALLRPGRFDHVLECRVPNEKDRADILKVHLRSVNHDPTVLCDEWAARTDGWTGADLKALITNAQFDAMRNTSVDQQQGDVAIRNVNIERAFNDFSPVRRVDQNRSGVGKKASLRSAAWRCSYKECQHRESFQRLFACTTGGPK
ncbi:hypothetical protein OSTOST_02974, partial [Ostertagia ostertagi]